MCLSGGKFKTKSYIEQQANAKCYLRQFNSGTIQEKL